MVQVLVIDDRADIRFSLAMLLEDNNFEVIQADNPDAARDSNDIHPGYRSHPEGSHIIFYVVDDDQQVNIIGIPHKSMDVSVLF